MSQQKDFGQEPPSTKSGRAEVPAELISAITSGNCVAFIGAGFSAPCKLPSWSKLLRQMIEKLENRVADGSVVPILENHSADGNFFAFLKGTVDQAEATMNGDLYDLAGQLLEDYFGTIVIEQLVEEQLALPPEHEIPPVMRERLEFLKAVPFKAILTTNFDTLLLGPTPWSHAEDFPYAQVLRGNIGATGNTSFSADEMIAAHVTEFQDDIYNSRASVETKLGKPIIKLHGSCQMNSSERALVWTRTGYRKLLHHTPGYANFMKAVMSTSTVLYLGFSFSDGYLNDIRGEVLSMLYGERRASIGRLPIGYAITNDKSVHECEFFERHEGVKFLCWNSMLPDGTRDYAGFDRFLDRIRELTSFQYYIGKIACGKRILVLEFDSVKFKAKQEAKAKAAKEAGESVTSEDPVVSLRAIPSSGTSLQKGKAKLSQMGDLVPILRAAVDLYTINSGDLEGTALDVVDTPAAAIAAISDANVAYDAIVTVFGEDRAKEDPKHWWMEVVTGMRALPACKQAPFIVYSTSWNCRERRKFCLSHGAYDFAVGFQALVRGLAKLLDTSADEAEEGAISYPYF
jgi:hypothetical protein